MEQGYPQLHLCCFAKNLQPVLLATWSPLASFYRWAPVSVVHYSDIMVERFVFQTIMYLLVALTNAVIVNMLQSRLNTNLRTSVYETAKVKLA